MAKWHLSSEIRSRVILSKFSGRRWWAASCSLRQWHWVSFQSWLQPGGPEAKSGDPSAVTSLTIQMDSLTFDQSEIVSEGSYKASLDSLEDSGASLASGPWSQCTRPPEVTTPPPMVSSSPDSGASTRGPGRHPAEPHPPGGGHRGACPRPNPAVITPSLTSESQRPTTALSEWVQVIK